MQTQNFTMATDVYLIKLDQPLSGNCAGDVENRLREIAQQGYKRIVLNLENVPFIDKRGLATLIAGVKALGNNTANLQLVAPQTQPKLLFELTGFDQIFHITDRPVSMVA